MSRKPPDTGDERFVFVLTASKFHPGELAWRLVQVDIAKPAEQLTAQKGAA